MLRLTMSLFHKKTADSRAHAMRPYGESRLSDFTRSADFTGGAGILPASNPGNAGFQPASRAQPRMSYAVGTTAPTEIVFLQGTSVDD
jgi:hypothetical protein